MAESFTTTNRFSTINIIRAGSLVTAISLSKKLNFLSAMVMPLTSWIWVNVNRQPKMKNSLSLFAVVSVSRSLMQNVYGSSIWLALSVLSVSIRCLAASRRWKVQKTTPSLTIKKRRGYGPFFTPAFFADATAADRSHGNLMPPANAASLFRGSPPRRRPCAQLSTNAATREWIAQTASVSLPASLHLQR